MAEENGNTINEESLPAKLEQIEQMLDEYEVKIGLNKKYDCVEPDFISREVLLAMSPEDIDVLRWEYASYALYLQKVINKSQSRLAWADHNLKRYLEKICQEYPGWKWEERQANALASDYYAQQLDKLRLRSKLVIERTSFLTNKIAALDSIAKDIAYTKRRYSNVGQNSD